MRVAIVENTAVTHHGQVGIALHEAGARIDLWKPWRDNALPDLGAYDALVARGVQPEDENGKQAMLFNWGSKNYFGMRREMVKFEKEEEKKENGKKEEKSAPKEEEKKPEKKENAPKAPEKK